MKVLLIGSGGREHALAWKLAASPLLEKLYCAPGNPGIAAVAELADIGVDDHAALIAFAKEKHIDLVVVGRKRRLSPGLPMKCALRASASSARPGPQPSLKARRASPRISARASISRPALMAVSTMRQRRKLYPPAGRAHRGQGRWACRRQGRGCRHDASGST